MSPVPPGDETGVYYIVVASLPWKCSWQKLKDFARNHNPDGSHIDIDHAHVYPGSTDGWVRVLGKESFGKAMSHLTTGIFEHRSLMVDGRNEKDTLHLRDAAPTISPAPSFRSRHDSTSTTESFVTSSSVYPYQEMPAPLFQGPEKFPEWNMQSQAPFSPISSVSGLSPVFSNGQYFQPAQLYDQRHFGVSPSPEFYTSGMVYTNNVSRTVYPVPPPIYAMVPISYMPANNTAPNLPMSPPPVSCHSEVQYPEARSQCPPMSSYASAPPVEARKIIITQLHHSTKESELKELLYHAATNGAGRQRGRPRLVSLEMAKHSDGKLRGHAFAVFENAGVAGSVVDSLDGTAFMGRKIQVRFAKEGVESRKASPARETYSVKKEDAGSVSYGRVKKVGDIGQSVKEMKRLSLRLELDVETRGKKESREKCKGKMEGETERKKLSREKGNGAPLVVDGSSGKSRKHR